MAVWTHIAHATLPSPAISVTWSSIAASYDHLYFKASTRTDESAYLTELAIQLNGVSDTDYSYTFLTADSTTPESDNRSGRTQIEHLMTSGASAQASTFGTLTCWIPHYANTTNYKQLMIENYGANQSNTNGRWFVGMFAGMWGDTPVAIDEVSIKVQNGSDEFITGCTFDLWGITGA